MAYFKNNLLVCYFYFLKQTLSQRLNIYFSYLSLILFHFLLFKFQGHPTDGIWKRKNVEAIVPAPPLAKNCTTRPARPTSMITKDLRKSSSMELFPTPKHVSIGKLKSPLIFWAIARLPLEYLSPWWMVMQVQFNYCNTYSR